MNESINGLIFRSEFQSETVFQIILFVKLFYAADGHFRTIYSLGVALVFTAFSYLQRNKSNFNILLNKLIRKRRIFFIHNLNFIQLPDANNVWHYSILPTK